MSIQYSGTAPVFDDSWAQSAGTKTELCNRIYANFIAAGWSSISVTGSAPNVTAFTVRSVLTPEGNQCEVICDTSSTNCIRLRMQEVNGFNLQFYGMYLLPESSRIWYMVINKYQFFIWVKGAIVSRGYVAGGACHIPLNLRDSVTISIWANTNGISDTSNTWASGFRYILDCFNGSSPVFYQNINGMAWSQFNASVNASVQRLVATASSLTRWDSPEPLMYWHDGSPIISDPLIAWSLWSNDQSRIRGQLWDSFISSDANNGDTQITFDGHNYIALTHDNGGISSYASPGTLWLATN